MKLKFNYLGKKAFLIIALFSLFASGVFGQGRTITGTITDSDGLPLPGTNILVKGTLQGTIADSDGNYSINVPGSDVVLVFSFLGYLTKEVEVDDQSQIDVTLESESTQLDELVVIGYGSVKKSDLTGSVSVINTDELQGMASNSPEQLLQGRAAGVVVTMNSGTPGGGSTVRIRGISSLNDADPLYVIDGFPVVGSSGEANALSRISPNDIESIDVLKDASATAIYGSRGANGVIIITTKRGQIGEPKFNFDYYHGITQPQKLLEMMDVTQYADYFNKYQLDLGEDEFFVETNDEHILFNNESTGNIDTINNPKTDWLSEILQPAPVSSYQLSVSGGDENTQYHIAGGYLDQQGIGIGSYFKRLNLRVNVDSKLSERLSIGASINLAHTSKDNYSSGTSENIFNEAFPMPPVISVYDDKGDFNGSFSPVIPQLRNPVGLALRGYHDKLNYSSLGNLYLDYEIIEGLKFRINTGANYNNTFLRDFIPDYKEGLHGKSADGGVAIASRQSGIHVDWLIENTLTYSKEFGDNHSLNLLAGYTVEENSYEYMYAAGSEFNHPAEEQLSSIIGTKDIGGFPSSNGLVSYLARATYGYDGKYLATLSLRADGSSRFGPGNKWGYFPSGSLAWRISKEEFMSDISAISDLKLRLGYGQTGNQQIGNYRWSSTMASERYINATGDFVYGLYPSSLPNSSIVWERTIMYNSGLDLSMFRNQLTLTIDAYYKTSDGLLIEGVPIPKYAGYRESFQWPVANIGIVENKGLEMTLGHKKVVGGLSYNFNLNLAYNQNELTQLNGLDPVRGIRNDGKDLLTKTDEGYPIGSYFGYVADGIFQNWEEVKGGPYLKNARPGDRRYVDINGDGLINANDQTYLGNGFPNWFYGFSGDINYKGFSLYMFVQGVAGNEILNFVRRRLINGASGTNKTADYYENRWQADENFDPEDESVPVNVINASNEYPGIHTKYESNGYISSYFVEPGWFVRIKDLTLSYNLPEFITEPLKIEGGRIYVKAQNLFTLSKYTGLDPEIGQVSSVSGSSSLAYGVDDGAYPIPEVYQLGINITF